jgi:uncharacterized circularly permuted ATP-grasp superfamily protein
MVMESISNKANPSSRPVYDEMFDAGGNCRPQYEALFQRLQRMPAEELRQRQHAADLSFLHQGITFNVYGAEESTERIFPYDLRWSALIWSGSKTGASSCLKITCACRAASHT